MVENETDTSTIRKPKYLEVKKAFRERILRDYPAGARIPSTAELHKSYGVSQGTIDRAIRELVEEELLERFVGRGTYVASAPRNRQAQTIGFVCPAIPDLGPADPSRFAEEIRASRYATAVMHGIEEEAHKSERHLILGVTRDVNSPKFVEGKPRRVDGILLLINSDPRLIKAYHDEGLPVTLVDPWARVDGVPFIANDNYSAGHIAASHLIRHGHRRILFVSRRISIPLIQWRERLFGYGEAVRNAGLEPMEFVISPDPARSEHRTSQGKTGSGSWLTEAAPEPFLEMLRVTKATACCCVDDDIAAWLIATCHSHGIRVPDDVSVVGTNDTGVAEHLWPALTTIHLNLLEMGRAAMRILGRLIDEKTLSGNSEVIPVQLIERNSVRQLR